jgi:hypothetical protein
MSQRRADHSSRGVLPTVSCHCDLETSRMSCKSKKKKKKKKRNGRPDLTFILLILCVSHTYTVFMQTWQWHEDDTYWLRYLKTCD